MTPRWLFFPAPVSASSDWSDYMSANSGVGYWVIPDGTASTGVTSGPTGGDSTTTWTQIIANANAGSGTTQSGTVISGTSAQWKRGLIGGYLQYSNPYDFCAVGWQGAGSSSYAQAHGPGWAILERESVAGTSSSGRQSFIPIEGSNGLADPTWAGGMPTWNASGYDDHIVFFFNNYISGDVQNWTTWDGTTTP